jgi:hypothetical protein
VTPWGYTILISGMILSVSITAAAAQTFGGDKCNKAGYEWAESKGITAREQCVDILKMAPKRASFYEGCLAYVEEKMTKGMRSAIKANPDKWQFRKTNKMHCSPQLLAL